MSNKVDSKNCVMIECVWYAAIPKDNSQVRDVSLTTVFSTKLTASRTLLLDWMNVCRFEKSGRIAII